jgi:hypothetical protein
MFARSLFTYILVSGKLVIILILIIFFYVYVFEACLRRKYWDFKI